MPRKTYETEKFVRPNNRLGTELSLSAVADIPEKEALERGETRPRLVWGRERTFFEKADRLVDSLGEGLWPEPRVYRRDSAWLQFVVRSFFNPKEDRRVFAYATPCKSLASHGAHGTGVLSDVKREPPRFLEEGQHSFAPGWGTQPLMFREWGLFNPTSLPRDGKSRPKYVHMECERWLDFGNGQVSPYPETTFCLAIPGRDDEALRSGQVPGVLDNPKWHDWGARVTSIPFLALGVLHEYRGMTFVTDTLFPLNPDDASMLHYTVRHREWGTFLATTPVACRALIEGGIIHERIERPWPSRWASEN